MVLRRQHRHDRPAIGESHDRQFFALKKLFDQDALSSVTEHRLFHRIADGLFRLLARRRNHDTLSLRQPISLHDDRNFMLIDIGQGWSDLVETLALRRENLRAVP